MRKDVARALKAKAEETARKYSSKTRANKKALAHFIHVDHPKNPFWQYYIMGSQHFINLNMLERKYAEIEQHNFKLNFEHIPKDKYESNMPKM